MIAREQERLHAVSENLANCQTPGFKRIQVAQKRFDSLFQEHLTQYDMTPNTEHYDPVAVDFTPGPMRPTDRALDFALRGNGFFEVRHGGQTFYTRNGHFTLDPNRVLRNADGFEVQGENGQIEFPPDVDVTKLTVSHDGTIRGPSMNANDGRQVTVGKFKVVVFHDTHRLDRAGTTLFKKPPDMAPSVPDRAAEQVVSGVLEMSNTTVYEELAELITTVRSFQASQKMLEAHDENQGRLVSAIS